MRAEQQLLPAVPAAEADVVLLADGYSCRTQLEDSSEGKGNGYWGRLSLGLGGAMCRGTVIPCLSEAKA